MEVPSEAPERESLRVEMPGCRLLSKRRRGSGANVCLGAALTWGGPAGDASRRGPVRAFPRRSMLTLWRAARQAAAPQGAVGGREFAARAGMTHLPGLQLGPKRNTAASDMARLASWGSSEKLSAVENSLLPQSQNQSGPEVAMRARSAGPPTRRAAATSSKAASRLRPWTAGQLSHACTTVSRVILPSVSSQIPDASTRVPSSYWQAT